MSFLRKKAQTNDSFIHPFSTANPLQTGLELQEVTSTTKESFSADLTKPAAPERLQIPETIVFLEEYVYGKYNPMWYWWWMFYFTAFISYDLYSSRDQNSNQIKADLASGILSSVFPAVYGLLAVFNVYFGAKISRKRWFAKTFERYSKIKKDFCEHASTTVEGTDYRTSAFNASRKLSYLTFWTAVLLVSLTVIPYLVSLIGKNIINAQVHEAYPALEFADYTRSDKLAFTSEIVTFFALFIPSAFLNFYFLGVWLWLCWMTQRLTTKIVEDFKEEDIVSRKFLAIYLDAIHTKIAVSRCWSINTVIRVLSSCYLCYFFLYNFLTAGNALLQQYNVVQYCLDRESDEPPSPSGNSSSNVIPTSFPTSMPSTVEDSYCNVQNEFGTTLITFQSFGIFIFSVQILVNFLVVVAIIGIPAYIGDAFSFAIRNKYVGFALDANRDIRSESIISAQLVKDTPSSLFVGGIQIGLEKMTIIVTVLGYILAYGASNALAAIQENRNF
jgi:hypothetical protein